MLSTYQITTHGLAAEASWGATVFAPDAILNWPALHGYGRGFPSLTAPESHRPWRRR